MPIIRRSLILRRLKKVRGELRMSKEAIDLEEQYSAHNYHPLPVVFAKAKGALVWDPEGREYLDFLSSYSAVNQGHCHPRIIKALIDQSQMLTLSSRAFHNDQFGKYAKFITQLFGYDRVLPMNTGAEAVETALKLARKWGYEKKGVPQGKALIIACEENFHGRTLGVISMSTDPDAYENFGPYLPGVSCKCPHTGDIVKHGDVVVLEKVFKAHHKNIVAFLVEPIQGEAGIKVPPPGYLAKVRELCTKYNVLLIADEIQTGIARTGKMLCVDHDNIKPDMILLGKALSGGVYPVSAVLADNEVMDCIRPGQHGSTFGGNPVGCRVAIEALQVVIDEKLCEKAEELGQLFRKQLTDLNNPLIKAVRGRGLLNAIDIDASKLTGGRKAWHICLLMKKYGVLAKPTHETIIRLAPPLVITVEQLTTGVAAIEKALKDIHTVNITDLE